ncbi:MAG: helix-turn-helix transcriptional regulator [Candidatus Synoicihabitans palmerolidicus]|nr:helix-turn-helix transcriptional regulator [Candidatus Synoicihabitans palmerolidicus]MCC5025373.1 helix-turn-helix transcriptional regulator [Candidatus Synoicihabitans palmerolidicus]
MGPRHGGHRGRQHDDEPTQRKWRWIRKLPSRSRNRRRLHHNVYALEHRHRHRNCLLPVKNQLRELRAAFKWSQSDLGAQLGVSRQTINAIETGKYDPSLPLAFKLARLFEKPIEEIFTDQ